MAADYIYSIAVCVSSFDLLVALRNIVQNTVFRLFRQHLLILAVRLANLLVGAEPVGFGVHH